MLHRPIMNDGLLRAERVIDQASAVKVFLGPFVDRITVL